VITTSSDATEPDKYAEVVYGVNLSECRLGDAIAANRVIVINNEPVDERGLSLALID
jgi:hypothetical protein